MSEFLYNSYRHSNGALRIAVMKNPAEEWDASKGDHHLEVELDPNQLDELFSNVLKVPSQIPVKRFEGESYDEYDKRIKKWFQDTLTSRGYEMLGRVWNIYEDVIYFAPDVKQLYKECLEIQQKTQNESASSILKSLAFGCNEALKTNSGLRLISD